MTEFGRVITQNEHNLHNGNFQFANLLFERGEILFSKDFFDFMDIRKLQDKAKTSYTLSTRRLRFGYEQQFNRSTSGA